MDFFFFLQTFRKSTWDAQISVTLEKWKIVIKIFLLVYLFCIFNFILRDAISFYSLLSFGNVLFSFVQYRNVPL